LWSAFYCSFSLFGIFPNSTINKKPKNKKYLLKKEIMKVKIYTTPTCPYCQMAETFFKNHKIEYREINVLDSLEAREEMFSKSHQQSVPVIEIGDEIVVGFDRVAIAKILGIKD